MEEEIKKFLEPKKGIKSLYIYYIFIVVVIAGFIFGPETVEVPMWGVGLTFLFLTWVGLDQSWIALKQKAFLKWVLNYKDKVSFEDFLELYLKEFEGEKRRWFKKKGIEPFEIK